MRDNSGWLAVDILYEGKLQVGLLLFYLLAAGSTVSEILKLFLRRRKTRWVSEFFFLPSFLHSFFLFILLFFEHFFYYIYNYLYYFYYIYINFFNFIFKI